LNQSANYQCVDIFYQHAKRRYNENRIYQQETIPLIKKYLHSGQFGQHERCGKSSNTGCQWNQTDEKSLVKGFVFSDAKNPGKVIVIDRTEVSVGVSNHQGGD
jgi:hypothetical protein